MPKGPEMNKGDKVKVFLTNSLSAEGTVDSYNELELILVSNGYKLVINNPYKNIIMYYVFSNPQVNSEFSDLIKKSVESEKNISNQELPRDLDLRIKKLVELKSMSAEAQREQIRKELTTFHSVNTEQILGKYGTPSFISPQHSASKEINDGNADDVGGLSSMPRQAPQ